MDVQRLLILAASAGAGVTFARQCRRPTYWPDLAADLQEVRRVLKPGGRVAIIAESYRGKRFDLADRLAMSLLGGSVLTTGAHRDVLIAAGYPNVEVYEERPRGWMCAVGTKSA